MVFQMMAVLNEFERNQASERTTAVMKHLKSQGRCVGRVPFGYDLGEDGKHLVPNEAEQKVVKRMKRMKRRGMSLRKIGTRLKADGIKTKRGKDDWTPRAVQLIVER